MKILGINYLSEASVSLLDNGKIKFAISEERINRIKNWYGSPLKSIYHTLNDNNLKISDIDYICTHGTSSFQKKNVIPTGDYLEAKKEIIKSNLKKQDKSFLLKKIIFREKKEKAAYLRNKKLLIKLSKKINRKLEIYDHHTCHAASAAYFSGWKNCMVLSIDGYGDSYSSKLFDFKNNKLSEIKSSSILNSLGYFYGSITKYLGFKPHRHEGKILGLAAYGKPKKAYKVMAKLIRYDKKIKNFKGGFKGGYLPLFENDYLKKILKNYSKTDIAAAAQKRLEDIVIDYIKDIKKKNFKIALAGGVFANVKLNQKIFKLKKIENIFIFPNMGDGGLCLGAAALSHIKHSKSKIKKIENAYLGKYFNDSQILQAIKSYKLNAKKINSAYNIIAKKLNEGKVVAVFNKKMEFGPRALGNRSILSRATDPNINKSLNKKLKRTEFMPFAPITLSNKKSEMYIDSKDKGSLAGKFMTMTFDCTKKMKELSPAAVHIDGTARPQFVSAKSNFNLYKILNSYFKISKIPNLINTSFNIHEEPIVYTPNDAARAFVQSKLDYMYIGKYLVSKS